MIEKGDFDIPKEFEDGATIAFALKKYSCFCSPFIMISYIFFIHFPAMISPLVIFAWYS